MIQWYKGREDYYCLELNFGGRKNSGSSNTIIFIKKNSIFHQNSEHTQRDR